MGKKRRKEQSHSLQSYCLNLLSLQYPHQKTAAGTSDIRALQTPACIDLAFLCSSLGLYTPLWLEVVMKDWTGLRMTPRSANNVILCASHSRYLLIQEPSIIKMLICIKIYIKVAAAFHYQGHIFFPHYSIQLKAINFFQHIVAQDRKLYRD